MPGPFDEGDSGWPFGDDEGGDAVTPAQLASAVSALELADSAEASTRDAADQNIQSEIDGLTAADVAFVPTGTLSSTDVQAAIAEAASEAAATSEPVATTHIADPSAAHAASAVGFTPAGGIGATDVQAAVVEANTDAVAAAAADATSKANAAQAAAIAASQPVDSDLTAIAALSTTSFGRAMLVLADAAAGRTALALGTAATQNTGAFDASGAAAAAQAASQPLDSDLTAIAALSTTSYGRAFLALADAAAARAALSLGTAAQNATGDFQPIDADLTSIAALSTTSFGRGFLDLADAAAARTKLALGTAALVDTGTGASNVPTITQADARYQPLDSDLTAIAALSTTSFGRSLLAAADAAALRTLAGTGTAALLNSGTGSGDLPTKTQADGLYQPLDSDLTSIAALATTTIGRSLLAAADAAALRTILALAAGATATAASGAEITTGTDAAKYVTPDALAGSDVTKRIAQLAVTDPNGSVVATGDGQAYFMVPAELNNYNLVGVAAAVTTVSSSGLPTVQIANVTDAVDILSTKITIDASEFTSYTALTAAVIDASKDDVQTGDILRVDVDVAGTGTKGLFVTLVFQIP